MTSIAVCIVSYFSDGPLLSETVRSLAVAGRAAGASVRLSLVDNSEYASDSARLRELVADWQAWLADFAGLEVTLTSAGVNGGYAAGNNAGLEGAGEDFVLILNPDAVLEDNALKTALDTFQNNPDCVLLAPRSLDADGNDLFLGHAYPSVLALAGRALPSLSLLGPVKRAMARYALQDLDPGLPHDQIVCSSGSFMLIPTVHWRAVSGFDANYFLYFEDYDLSIRLKPAGRILYAPQVRLRHMGGNASGKGWRHTKMFISSAARFFIQHGLRWS